LYIIQSIQIHKKLTMKSVLNIICLVPYWIEMEWRKKTGILTWLWFFSKLGKNKHIWHYLPFGMCLVIWPVATLIKRHMFSWIFFGKQFDLWNIHQILYKYLLFVIIFLPFFNLILFSSYMYLSKWILE
jgi:hypothetical protein